MSSWYFCGHKVADFGYTLNHLFWLPIKKYYFCGVHTLMPSFIAILYNLFLVGYSVYVSIMIPFHGGQNHALTINVQ